MRSVEELAKWVRQQGGKATSQRILIWGTLAQDRTHPTAKELPLSSCVPRCQDLSLATVYNVLNELVEWGEIRRFDTGDGCIHFDPNLRTSRQAGLHALSHGRGCADDGP